MKKTVWIARTADDNSDAYEAFDTRYDAECEADYCYGLLTRSEKRDHVVTVESYDLEIDENDTRTAREIYEEHLHDDDPATMNPDYYAEWNDKIVWVVNDHLIRVNFAAAVELMDDEIREQLHAEGFDDEQDFFSAYEKAHAEKYGEPWALSGRHPQY